MRTSTGTLILAVYPDRATARQDLRTIRDLHRDDIDVIYAALVAKDSTGFVSSERTFAPPPENRTEHATRLAGHFHRGLTRDDIHELGEMLARSSIAIVVVLSGRGAADVVDLLRTEDVMVDQITNDDVAFQGLLRAYGGIGTDM